MQALRDLKPHLKLYVAENCYLRPLVESDVTESYVDGLNSPVVNKYLVGVRKQKQTPETTLAYVRLNYASETDILFGIFIDDGLRGTVRLHDIDRELASARIGILLFDTSYWQKGWATRAIRAAIAFGSDVLGISRFRAGMIAQNIGSQKTFAGLGFRYCAGEDWVDEDHITHHFWVLDLNR